MNEKKNEMWNVLTELDGDTVLQLLTGWNGLQLLDDDFYNYMIDEGYIEEAGDEDVGEDEECDYCYNECSIRETCERCERLEDE